MIEKYEDSLRGLQGNMKCKHTLTIGIPEGEEKEQGIEKLFKKMIENFLNLESGKDMSV